MNSVQNDQLELKYIRSRSTIYFMIHTAASQIIYVCCFWFDSSYLNSSKMMWRWFLDYMDRSLCQCFWHNDFGNLQGWQDIFDESVSLILMCWNFLCFTYVEPMFPTGYTLTSVSSALDVFP